MAANAPSLDRVSLRTARRGFYELNRQRLDQLRQGLRPRQRVFTDLLPLLFHVNHPLLPGYVAKDTPAGVSHYRPSRDTVNIARRLARSFEPPRRAPLTFPIQGLYLMGSMGTIAQSERSDLDIWVCHDPQLDVGARRALGAKARALGEWAARLGLDAHLFLIDPDAFRAGAHVGLSTQSSGSLQPTLLLDEFYRTAVLLAGRHPLWWMIPPHQESDYGHCARTLLEQRFVRTSDVIDFGGVSHVPAEEFVGAALWQTYKAADAPYKSVLKLLLMESYADEFPQVELLSHRFKQAVYRGEADADALDPYVLMSARVEEYLRRRGEPMRLELARRCLYYKVNRPIMRRTTRARRDWRDTQLDRLVEGWGWSDPHVIMLDTRADWKIDRVIEERNLLAEELNHSYHVLAAFARTHVPHVTEEGGELGLLTRKLQARLGRRAGKVDLINPGISHDVSESHLIFERQAAGWALLRGSPIETTHLKRLRRGHRLIELLAWCHFNGLVTPHTALGVRDEAGAPLETGELRQVMACLRQWFPDIQLSDAGTEALARAPATRIEAVFVNLGADPFAGLTHAGLHRTTHRTDALSFSGVWHNLIVAVDRVAVNSWHEVIVQHHEGDDALAEALCDHLDHVCNGEAEAPAVHVHGFPDQRGGAIAARVAEVFAEATACFARPGHDSARLALGVGRGFYIVERTPEGFVHRYAPTREKLFEWLGAPRACYCPPVLDHHTLADSPLPALLAVNGPDMVQLFYHVRAAGTAVYVLDEQGSLYHDTVETRDAETVVGHYLRFLAAVSQRRRGLEGALDADHGAVACYRVVPGNGGFAVRAVATAPPTDLRYLSVQVIAERADPTLGQFTVYCDDEPFSPLEYGERVFEAVVARILAHRHTGARYPVYITDLDLADGNTTARAPQTVELLNAKRRIEERLNHALRAMAPDEVGVSPH